ncbi:MAG: dihydroorotate dehydrogenase electron transfer subunit [Actinomycetes bacterium]
MMGINSNAKQVIAEIVSNKKVGAYHHMVFAVGELASAAKPGNFAAISVGGESSQLVLRRAFAIYRTFDRGANGGLLEIVVAPHGAGSTWLTNQQPGIKIDLIAPLGTAFGIPTEPVRALLVGGGYGSAPLFGLSEVLKNRGCRVDMVLGASTAMKIYAPLDGKRSVSSLTITTEDGSTGKTGKVTDVIREMIASNEIDIIYSCGPMGMLEAINDIAEEFNLTHQCSIEESMACGIGVCMTCVIPIKGDDGVIRMLRSCIDGPVVAGESVIWSAKRTIPEGTWGAL